MKLKVKNVKKYFGGVKAVDECNFEIVEGKITAIIGPNGSGKSTIFHLISNIENKDSGKISLGEKDISLMKDYQIARCGVSRTFQEVRLFRNLTIKDHIEIALCDNDEKFFRSFWKGEVSKEDRVKEILKLVHLDKPLNTLATDLSYGQRKLLDLAIAIAKPHSLLMLDEPVAGVNPKLRMEIKDILKRLNDKGETILLIEHDMNFVMDLAEKIIVMDAGKVLVEGTPKQIQKNKKVLEAYLGE
jgi:ABC-type branched-subunit amino acid transport system ATPase component